VVHEILPNKKEYVHIMCIFGLTQRTENKMRENEKTGGWMCDRVWESVTYSSRAGHVKMFDCVESWLNLTKIDN